MDGRACEDAFKTCAGTHALKRRSLDGSAVASRRFMWAPVLSAPSSTIAATWACAASWSSYCSVTIDVSEVAESASSELGSVGAALATNRSTEWLATRDARATLASFDPWPDTGDPEGLRVPARCSGSAGSFSGVGGSAGTFSFAGGLCDSSDP